MTAEVEAKAEDKILRVKSDTSVQELAKAIANTLYSDHHVTARAIGAGAVNQCIKAIAVARGFVAPRGYDLVLRPGFTDIESHDGTISAVVFHISI